MSYTAAILHLQFVFSSVFGANAGINVALMQFSEK